jgi:predicted aspartyl protease
MAKQGLKSDCTVELTIALAEGTLKVQREVIDALEITWKGTRAVLPAVVLPGTGFKVLLGMSWIKETGVGFDPVRQHLTLNGQVFQYQ